MRGTIAISRDILLTLWQQGSAEQHQPEENRDDEHLEKKRRDEERRDDYKERRGERHLE